MAGSPPGGNGGGKRSSGGSSVAAGRKAKERYDSKKSKERWKANARATQSYFGTVGEYHLLIDFDAFYSGGVL